MLHDYKTTTASFNLWMSKGANDIFALNINFLIVDWQLGLFEANETIGQVVPKNLAYVKNERSNLNTMIIDLKSIINYELLGLDESLLGCCFRLLFSKTCQYGTTNEKMCIRLKHVSIKFAQLDIQKCITWPKMSQPHFGQVWGEAQHSQSWGLGALWDSRMFRVRQQGPKHLALKCSWCRWKGLEA